MAGEKKQAPLNQDVINDITALAKEWNETSRKVLGAAMSSHALIYDKRAIDLLEAKLDFNGKELLHLLRSKQ